MQWKSFKEQKLLTTFDNCDNYTKKYSSLENHETFVENLVNTTDKIPSSDFALRMTNQHFQMKFLKPIRTCLKRIKISKSHQIKTCPGTRNEEYHCDKCGKRDIKSDKTLASGHALNHENKKQIMMPKNPMPEIFVESAIPSKMLSKLVLDNIKYHICHLCGEGFGTAEILKFHIQKIRESFCVSTERIGWMACE